MATYTTYGTISLPNITQNTQSYGLQHIQVSNQIRILIIFSPLLLLFFNHFNSQPPMMVIIIQGLFYVTLGSACQTYIDSPLRSVSLIRKMSNIIMQYCFPVATNYLTIIKGTCTPSLFLAQIFKFIFNLNCKKK